MISLNSIFIDLSIVFLSHRRLLIESSIVSVGFNPTVLKSSFLASIFKSMMPKFADT